MSTSYPVSDAVAALAKRMLDRRRAVIARLQGRDDVASFADADIETAPRIVRPSVIAATLKIPLANLVRRAADRQPRPVRGRCSSS
jgi:hypothetical protein